MTSLKKDANRRRRNGLRIYGVWGGNPQGVLEDPTCCIVGVWPNGRGAIERQCGHHRGRGPNGLYCRQHDPKVVAEKSRSKANADEARRRQQKAIVRKAARLARALGVKANAHYHVSPRYANCGYHEALVVPFGEARKLLARLPHGWTKDDRAADVADGHAFRPMPGDSDYCATCHDAREHHGD